MDSKELDENVEFVDDSDRQVRQPKVTDEQLDKILVFIESKNKSNKLICPLIIICKNLRSQ